MGRVSSGRPLVPPPPRASAAQPYTCYEKAKITSEDQGDITTYAQCLRTGSCADRAGWEQATCAELEPMSECGDHPGAECTLSACCEGELQCYMKDWTLSRCMRGCDPNSGWSCHIRDKNHLMPPPPPPPLYHSTRDVRCADFRARSNNLKKRPCSEVGVDACASSYMVVDGVYTPCVAFKEQCASGDPLKCDCELKGKDCPVASALNDGMPGGGGGAGGGGEELGVGVVELVVVVVSVILVVLGCAAGVWMCCLRQTDETQMLDEAELEERDSTTTRKGKKVGRDEAYDDPEE